MKNLVKSKLFATAFLAVGVVGGAHAQDCPFPYTDQDYNLSAYNEVLSFEWFRENEGQTVFINSVFDFSESVAENYDVLAGYPLYDSSDVFVVPLSEITFPFPTVDWESGQIAPNYIRFVGPEDGDIDAYSMGILYLNVSGFYTVNIGSSDNETTLLTLEEVDIETNTAATCRQQFDVPAPDAG
ncbi:hypothetical protein [Ponticaulis sp.]|uniref:hypothetical protein n=1 Tax=Ponticaulis sp. TaxID=2020902 RepID=UPI000B6986C6|nr:hypothetical protein [Ponticaulis sp.]MAJ09319.1 hypothetical protein [Ponticaulis sp.]RPG18673.1 MAG: hypothetical protein CBC85_000095 [Hyphomonadaceae bacterium TMED125]HBH91281.1 hypothetical protein [Hyphomonadaceae bacterium]HBJ92530.1 hypothetical protein [Hyphomonadaceae bacterium]|tara:strand:+ start:3500 stop:4051 length:552 start_codon:yes stop_codon:yes gene_type:complete